jgi:8-oxo-dGTP pyrophosphatase MutT (NUDIX family)
MRSIKEFAPDGTEAGVGLALRDDQGRYLFFLAGRRYGCQPGTLFYAGVGGHREAGESWEACARREALEEVGQDAELLPAETTWLIGRQGQPQRVQLTDRRRPLALYEMIHPTGTPRAGRLYRLVVFRARLLGPPGKLAPEEVQGLIGLTPAQVVRGPAYEPEEWPSLGDLCREGAVLVAGGETLDPETRLYPLGTAVALAHVLRLAEQ